MMTELTIIAVVLIPLLVVGALLFHLLTRQRSAESSFARLDARLDEQGKRAESLAAQLGSQARANEDIIRRLDQDVREQLSEARDGHQRAIHQLREDLSGRFGELRRGLEERHGEHFKTLQETLQSGVDRVQEQVAKALTRNNEEMGRRMAGLTESTDKRLLEIGGLVDKRLSDGFEKTAATFGEVQKRLALIDQAQKNITELSSSVVSLQEILADRTSRGTFGEVQLHGLIRNVLPERGYRMQHKLSNDKIVDCMLFLPEPSGHMPIDSKFPLENFRRMTDTGLPQTEREAARKTFAKDVTAHIDDIAAKYIIPGETADAALMFVPAEAVFAEIHAGYPDLVERAHRARVLMASPTTLWAILTTTAAVLKDAATREQVNIIQEHLGKLGVDFRRFRDRLDNLAQHMDQAHRDVEQVHISAGKITSRFDKIESLEMADGAAAALPPGGSNAREPESPGG